MKPTQPTRLILASNSPRRRSLLDNAGYVFEVIPADEAVEDKVTIPDDIHELPVVAARAKCLAVASQLQSGVVLAADTLAICDQRKLGKPLDRYDARNTLKFLSGREHDVLTAVCLIDCATQARVEHLESTRLRMDLLTDEQIDAYLETELWRGKAGSFGFQDGWDWLHVISGSETNVVGLPLERLPQLFSELAARNTATNRSVG